jgi:very-short-patch-repair endonuclease
MEPWTITVSLLESGSGLVTGSQLRAAGVSPRWVSRQILAGRLHRVLPGVLSATPDFDAAGWLRAVLAQAGPDAALTHVTALWNWGLVDDLDFPYHVAVPRMGCRHGERLTMHHLGSRESVLRNGLPTVPVGRALVAAAMDVPLEELRFPAMEAVRSGLIVPADLDPTGLPRRAMGAMRHLHEEAEAGAESGGEAQFYRLIKESGLPLPQLQVVIDTAIGPKRLDAYWGQFRLGVEIDGRSVHAQRDAFENDRVRQNAIHATGELIIRFSVRQVMAESKDVVEWVEANMIARARLLGVRMSRYAR